MEPLVFVLVTTEHADDRRDDAPTLFGGATWPSHLITDTHRC